MATTPPDNHIAWTVAPATNTLRFEHVGCSVGDGTWTHPLDDIHLPLSENRTHCECCGLEKRLRRGNGSAEIFRLDRTLLRAYLVTDGDTDIDDDTDPEGISSACYSALPRRSPRTSRGRSTPALSSESPTSRSSSTSAPTTR
ncbi:MAG TPA: hypothetical protein VGO80_06435 [Solirubrobacteraceae bacterium]|jgi:hypothetical protein|nr:hypothetical protein [Solirubrobacteraceae bacterium]